jgi:hypothetical protein
MITDNEVEMAMSSMINGKNPLLALNRLTSNMSSFLKHSVFSISFIYILLYYESKFIE